MNLCRGLSAQIHNVAIRPETRVVGEIPAVVIRIWIENDVVSIPIPIGTVIEVVRRNAEEKSFELEAFTVSAVQAEHIIRSDRAREASVLPRMIEAVVGIVAARGMAQPLAGIGVNVRRLRVFRLIAECAPLISLGISLVRLRSVRLLLRRRLIWGAARYWRCGARRFLTRRLMCRSRRPAAGDVAVAYRRSRLMRISACLIPLISATLIAALVSERRQHEKCYSDS